MNAWVTMVLTLSVLVLAGPTAPAGAEHTTVSTCASNVGEIPLALGSLPTGLPDDFGLLAGLSYVDMPFDNCSDGGFVIHSESGNIRGTRNCAEQYVRVWGLPGSAGEDFEIFWKTPGQNGCPA